MSELKENNEQLRPWQQKLHEVIYEADTPAGKMFDIILLIAIILSVLAVMLESIPDVGDSFKNGFIYIEWGFTTLFTIEYVARIVSIKKPFHYIFSFYGVIDLLSILPTYLGLFLPFGSEGLVIRSLRLLRVFRILKLGTYLSEAKVLTDALKASRKKITVFIFAVLMMTIILGTLMYLVEGPEHGFTSIPQSIYWAIVTMTTVGYGDMHPKTDPGEFIAAVVMILGYAIIAVPTGIVSRELIIGGGKKSVDDKDQSNIACTNCGSEGHEDDADYCKKCGEKLHD